MRERRGQSSVELMLMIPVIFGLLFAVVELAFWLGGTHFTTYAAFAGARAQQVGRDPAAATEMLLDGRATSSQSTSGDGQSVTVNMPWAFDLPFVSAIGSVDYEVSATAGPDEFQYEGRSGKRASRYGDNNCPSGGC